MLHRIARRIETRSFACVVITDEEDIIVEIAPILGRFIGQPFKNVEKWLIKNKIYFKIDD